MPWKTPNNQKLYILLLSFKAVSCPNLQIEVYAAAKDAWACFLSTSNETQ